MEGGPSELFTSSTGFQSSCTPRVSQDAAYRDLVGKGILFSLVSYPISIIHGSLTEISN